MKASRISSGAISSGGMNIPAENTNEYRDYGFSLVPPSISAKKCVTVKLSELCNICCGFVKHGTDMIDLSAYPSGLKMSGGESQSIQSFGWGKYKDVDSDKKKKGKCRLVINDANTKYNGYSLPKDLIK